ncbi:MAG TPA: exodeoxyribonuclease VII large subunit, partial [Alkalispirochaeta sp.]|nr:exodeoxyribonuclease VII large subunit [Alkalispirochaeta sp.]
MEDRGIYSVSDLTSELKTVLEAGFSWVTVEGELSNLRPSARGHRYFSLKDEHAVLPCVMFRGDSQNLDFVPQDGDVLEVRGSVSIYAPRGSYQLVVRSMKRAGTGRILALIEERKRKFAREGLFDTERALPTIPRRVAVITSPTGAAIRDILHVLHRREPPLDVRIIPVTVQGSAAATEIARAISYTNRHRLADVIIITRGGGSVEDLLPFSDEPVIRAIAESETPVISAVGHEVDWALSDFAADLRAPTPSAAAEIVSEGGAEVFLRIERAATTAVGSFLSKLSTLRNRCTHVSEAELRYRFRNLLQPWYQRFDEAHEALQVGITAILEQRRTRLTIAQ